MTEERRSTAEPWLEGLVLFDGTEFYEVPRVVIERYRVPDERRADVSAVQAFVRTEAAAWVVCGAIYAPATSPLTA